MNDSTDQDDTKKFKRKLSMLSFALIFVVFAGLVMVTILTSESLRNRPHKSEDIIEILNKS